MEAESPIIRKEIKNGHTDDQGRVNPASHDGNTGWVFGHLPLTTPAHAAMDQFSGVGVLAGADQCSAAPCGFDEYTLVMTGDLEGCLYTNIVTARTTPSGVYLESGQEPFVGSLNGGPEGTFTTTYKFEAKFAPDGSEVHGRCQHPIADDSGTGGFEGASGRLNFKDIVETGEFVYKGHINLG